MNTFTWIGAAVGVFTAAYVVVDLVRSSKAKRALASGQPVDADAVIDPAAAAAAHHATVEHAKRVSDQYRPTGPRR